MIVLIGKKKLRELTDRIDRLERLARQTEQSVGSAEGRLSLLEIKQRVASADRHGLACQIRDIRKELKNTLKRWQYVGR